MEELRKKAEEARRKLAEMQRKEDVNRRKREKVDRVYDILLDDIYYSDLTSSYRDPRDTYSSSESKPSSSKGSFGDSGSDSGCHWGSD